MNKYKLFGLVAICLLAINLTLVGYIFFREPHHPRHGGPRDLIIKKLHFDADQIAAYEVLIQGHRKDINQSDAKIMGLKNSLYGHLPNENDRFNRDSVIHEINLVQAHIEETHYKHFEDIKKLCKPNQLDDYRALTTELAKLFNPQKPPPPRDRP